MIWPNATDYNAAVQNPQLCFSDDELRRGQAVGDLFGLPRPHSGNFADVYQIQGADGQSWAVKCFTRPVAGLRTRYHAISEHLRHAQRAFMVAFDFLDEGICIRGQWHPLVKMRWVEGFRLNDFVREHANKPVLLERLAQLWLRLAGELRDADMAHGDLQHGNVLLVPGSKSSSLALKLIDYDGMFVPALADRPSGEVGHPNYQHPQRLREGGYDRRMDRFAHLLIYTALRCLHVGGEELWQRYDNLENLLFREEDFRRPSQSRLLRELWDITDRDSRNLLGHLLLASQGPLSAVPRLEELVDDSGVRPLSDGAEGRINDLLGGGTRPNCDRKRADLICDFARNGKSNPQTAVLAAAPTVSTAALTDTKPIRLGVKTAEMPASAIPPPPTATPAKTLFDVAALTDPLVSMLSQPAWLATLGAVALISFLVINVMVWSSVTPLETTEVVVDPKTPIQVDTIPKPKQEDTIPKPKQEDTIPKPKQEAITAPKPKQEAITAPKPKQEDTIPKPKQEAITPKPKQGNTSPKPKQEEQKPRGQQERVHFRSVDHIELAGTLYHGWKGKKGMTVLMLHDLGSTCNSPGWKRLAEALQAEGHTVLTFDFRGHGDSKKVSPPFWNYPVNKYLLSYEPGMPAEKQPKTLEANSLPTDYLPWLIEDIAAARTYLDLRHDEPAGPVNTFNLVVLGAGQASALGSLWLGTEGLRYNATDMGNKILVKLPEKLSVRQAVWLGMADPLKLSPFGIHSWLEGAHTKPVVPICFLYGEDDIDTSSLLSLPIHKKYGDKAILPGARQSGQRLLDADAKAAGRIQRFLVKKLEALPPVDWVPRKIKTLRSFWRIPQKLSNGKEQDRWFVAKCVDEETLLPAPFWQLGIPIKGLVEPPSFVPGKPER